MALKSVPLYRVTSRKVSSVSLMSCVNFMVSCSLFIAFISSENCLWDPVQMIKISMNLFQIWMCCSGADPENLEGGAR